MPPEYRGQHLKRLEIRQMTLKRVDTDAKEKQREAISKELEGAAAVNALLDLKEDLATVADVETATNHVLDCVKRLGYKATKGTAGKAVKGGTGAARPWTTINKVLGSGAKTLAGIMADERVQKKGLTETNVAAALTKGATYDGKTKKYKSNKPPKA